MIIPLIMVLIYTFLCDHPRLASVQYNYIKQNLKTGDLILFHSLDNINALFMGSYYTHVGVVVVLDKPYIFEAFNYNTMPFYPPEFSSGIAFACLENRLNSYRGYCFYKELSLGVSEEAQQNLLNFISYAKGNMYYETNIFLNFTKKIVYNEILQNGTNCGEIVFLCLIQLGLLDVSALNNNRRHHLRLVAGLTDVIDNVYKKPIYVLSNYFTQ
jgi:hypothetical protein